MTALLAQALEQVGRLSREEQDAIASQIIESLADEALWKTKFADKRDLLLRMAEEALEEDSRGETITLDRSLC